MRDFNFFSIYVDEKNKKRREKLVKLTSVMAVIVIFTAMFLVYQLKIMDLEKRASELETVINSQERLEGIEKYNNIKQQSELMGNYYEALISINKKITSLSNINVKLIDDLQSTLPGDLFITGFSATPEILSIQGVSKSKTSIAEFQHNLKGVGSIYDVHINIINKESNESDNFIFSARCTLKDVLINED